MDWFEADATPKLEFARGAKDRFGWPETGPNSDGEETPVVSCDVVVGAADGFCPNVLNAIAEIRIQVIKYGGFMI